MDGGEVSAAAVRDNGCLGGVLEVERAL